MHTNLRQPWPHWAHRCEKTASFSIFPASQHKMAAVLVCKFMNSRKISHLQGQLTLPTVSVLAREKFSLDDKISVK